ncbi:MAG: MarR family winged helix-turn-helix transcriptional regulator [Dehalococcoides mccartyi]
MYDTLAGRQIHRPDGVVLYAEFLTIHLQVDIIEGIKGVSKQTMEYSEAYKWDPNDAASLLLMRSRRAIYKELEKAYFKIGISPEQAGVFDQIATRGKATISDITHRLLREPHTILGLINRMEANGLIFKEKDPDNHSMITISLTEKGYDVYWQMLEIRNNMVKPTSVLADDEREQLEKLLQKILDASLDRLGKYIGNKDAQ